MSILPGESVVIELNNGDECGLGRSNGDGLESVDEVEHLVPTDVGIFLLQTKSFHGR